MNVLWTKRKNISKIYNQDTVTLHAHASGDGGRAPGRCCRLCGGDASLRSFGDTFVWEGVEERYDKLLYDCFGVTVSPSDCMICERCVRQLRNTERFKALVHAAFDKPASEASSIHTIPMLRDSFVKSVTGDKTAKRDKDIMDMLKTRTSEQPKRRDVRKKIVQTENNGGKRIYIQCEVCRQRYPMIMPTDGLKKFVCSRCKKNGDVKSAVCRKCNIGMPISLMKEHMELHAKADLRGKTRLLIRQAKKAAKRINSPPKVRTPPKYECDLCSKKCTDAPSLLAHVKNAHGDNADMVCRECGQMLEPRDTQEEPCSPSPAACRLLVNSIRHNVGVS